MNSKSRITSILNASALDTSVTGFSSFPLSELNLPEDLEFDLPTNVRLGHLAENVISECIRASNSHDLLFANIQLHEDKKTIGELDFILQNTETLEVTHVEMAYKFYLYDPNISGTTLTNWIGPNRNDTLHNKLEKLRSKQFPLLHHPAAADVLKEINVNTISQKLCLLASLFTPYQFKQSFSPAIKKAICGHYTNFETFQKLHHSSKYYYLPHKKDWGINPSEGADWKNFTVVEKHIRKSLDEKQAVLYWENDKGNFSTNFIVWW